jgi:hypothetical protein
MYMFNPICALSRGAWWLCILPEMRGTGMWHGHYRITSLIGFLICCTKNPAKAYRQTLRLLDVGSPETKTTKKNTLHVLLTCHCAQNKSLKGSKNRRNASYTQGSLSPMLWLPR